MKKIILLPILFISSLLQAQMAASINLDINNVNARLMTAGDMFWNPATGTAAYEFPKGSNKNSNWAAALWIGGYDASTTTLKVAAQTYRQNGSDYWAGPLSTTSTIDSLTSQKWDRFWKVNKTTIDSFIALSTHTVANTPPSILDWPAKGNIFAKDANGLPFATMPDMAPFVDANNNGTYSALDGDYPLIKGDQAIWWVFNDQRMHSETGSAPLNIQVKAMAFACASIDTAINNTTYYDYEIKSFDAATLNNTRIGFWNDIDLGNGFDDYIGFDSTRRMGIVYNGDALDEGPNGYGTQLTQTGVIVIKSPNDSLNYKEPLGAFISYDNNFTVYGNPSNILHYYNYMNAIWKNGKYFTKSCYGNDTTQPNTNFMYPDEPDNVLGWSEKQCNNIPNDRKILMSTNNFTLAPATTYHYSVAITNTPLGCNNCNFTKLKSFADVIIANPDGCYGTANPSAINSIEKLNDITLFPNPVMDNLQIDFKNNALETISIMNIMGQELLSKNVSHATSYTFDLRNLTNGIYFVKLKNGNDIVTKRFVKK